MVGVRCRIYNMVWKDAIIFDNIAFCIKQMLQNFVFIGLCFVFIGRFHIEVCNGLVQHLMGNSPDHRLNFILERISLVIVSIDPVFRYPHRKWSKGIDLEVYPVPEKHKVEEIRVVVDFLTDSLPRSASHNLFCIDPKV